MGQDTHLLTPGLHDFSRSDPSLLRAKEFELDGGDIGFRVQRGLGIESPTLDSRPLPDRYRHPGQQRRRIRIPALR